MMAPPEENPAPDSADEVDSALEALWRGDGAQFDRLLDSDDSTGPRLGDLFEDAIALHAELILDSSAEPKVDGYEIEDRIGHGGMGMVYKALQLSTKRNVALKVMRAGSAAPDSARQRFQREVELTARFQHPGIVRVLEGGQTRSGQPYYTMDFVDAVRLSDWISASKPDVRMIARLFRRLCEVVEFAHCRDVVHSDLKPGNVLVDDEGRPHVLDFGLARALDSEDVEAKLSSSDSPGGTLPYLSPEQVAGTPQEIDARTDVWAVGAMLFEALSGQPPFGARGSASEIRQRICNDAPPPPSSLSNDVDYELNAIILRALEKDKGDRYQSAQEMGDDLRRYLGSEPIRAIRSSATYMLRKKLAKHRLGLALTAAGLLLALGALFTLERMIQGERAEIRREVLRLQSILEVGWPGHSSNEAQNLLRHHRGIPEVALVRAQALWKQGVAGQQTEDEGWIQTPHKTLRDAIRRNPSLRWLYEPLLAEIRREMGDHAEAGRSEDSIAREGFPNSAEACYLRSFATLDLERARQYASTAVELDPKHVLAWQRLAYLRQETGEPERALKAEQKAIEHGADRYDLVRFQGDLLLAQGRYGEAIEQYNRAAEFSPDVLYARELATAYLCLCDYPRAVEAYAMVAGDGGCDLSPHWAPFYHATALWITGDTTGAAQDYRAICSEGREASYAGARLFLILNEEADMIEGQGRGDHAEDKRREAKEALKRGLAGTAPEGWLHRIFECLGGKISTEMLVSVAEADPNSREQLCEAYYYAGEVCLLNGRTAEGCNWFKKCVETELVFDAGTWPPVPMNEYHLAKWRLEDLCTHQ
jgi:tetratricopeptide (TPR) repeat protein